MSWQKKRLGRDGKVKAGKFRLSGTCDASAEGIRFDEAQAMSTLGSRILRASKAWCLGLGAY